MNTTTQDIDTSAAPVLVITDTKHLSDVIYEMASSQLVLNGAQAHLQATIEAAKKAYDDATREAAEKITEQLAAVEVFAAKNRNVLFPLKGKTRQKTFKVLQHALKYRSSDSVEAPADAVPQIKDIIAQIRESISKTPPGAAGLSFLLGELDIALRLLRTPEPEMIKDCVKLTYESEPPAYKALAARLDAVGIRVTTTETFKVEFNFTPTSSNA